MPACLHLPLCRRHSNAAVMNLLGAIRIPWTAINPFYTAHERGTNQLLTTASCTGGQLGA